MLVVVRTREAYRFLPARSSGTCYAFAMSYRDCDPDGSDDASTPIMIIGLAILTGLGAIFLWLKGEI